ncbi:TetR family transcriptional regulator [Solwaraspora sp. WMMD791]|uniref:TetR/AcrR family transcriptional regulator n=1 Tax=Solwaraspora sp. WMMD791 TaxID=3016086 RepID=UPI00249C6F99|nr:TetR family transcriptional regulator [Solwaraspora sp. WMMD791]WFE27440.1 TetR family transcriptional regulator [Solwaraspora sp. WMMD791]
MAATSRGATSRGATHRGAARRDALLAAACELIREVGFDQTSHRAVATRAGLPLAATTYYFTTLDALLAAAAEELMRQHLAAGRAVVDAFAVGAHGGPTPQRLAAAVVSVLVGAAADPPPAQVAALYERFLQAGRRPAVREMVRDWNAALAGLIDDLLRRAEALPAPPTDVGGAPSELDGDVGGAPSVTARTVLALADGMLLAELAEGNATALHQARHRLAAVLPTVTALPAAG